MGNYIKFIHKKLSFLIVMAYNESVHNASPSHLHRVTRLLTPAEENKFVTRDSVSLGIVRLLRHYFRVHEASVVASVVKSKRRMSRPS